MGNDLTVDFDFVVGEFSIHVDNPQDRRTKELGCVLNDFGLT